MSSHQPPDPSVPAPAEEMRRRVEAAMEEVYALCKGPHRAGGKSFRMSIPADPRRDSDLVLIAGLEVAETLLDAERQARAADPREEGLLNLIELAWGVIANAGYGDWSRESRDWQDAASRWRDAYHEVLDGLRVPPAPAAAPAPLREALEQALDDLETAFHRLTPEFTADDHEALAQTLWFGQERARRALDAHDARAAAESAGLPLDADLLAKALKRAYWATVIDPDDAANWLADAEFVAREYAVLASPATSQGTGEEA